MLRKIIVFAVIIIAVSVAGIFIWRNQESKAKAAMIEATILRGLTTEEIELILQSQVTSDPETVLTMKQSAEARQAFLKKLRGTFALAAEARREGLAEDPNFKFNLEYKRNALLQTLYLARIDKNELKAAVTSETIQAVWTDPANEAAFNNQIEALRAIQKVYAQSRDSVAPASKPEGEKLEKARKEWAVTKILADRAKADAEFMAQPVIALRFRILETGLLAADYANKHWQKKVKASSEEIKTYLEEHPEYDLAKKYQRAKTVLQRVKDGEDFSKLASEFSEDRSTKDKGGLYENIGNDVVWPEVENAALMLEKGQIFDTVVETHNGFHILKLEDKQIKMEEDGSRSVSFSIRHIMFQKAFEEPGNKRPGVPPPFLKPEEIAKAEVEKEKYQAIVDDLVQRNHISLPDDFVVNLPEDLERDALKKVGLTDGRAAANEVVE